MTRLYRILIVDDEEEVRASIIHKIHWNAIGFDMVGDAENGEDALEKIEALEPDLVLTDIRMPYMDGVTLAGRIKQQYPAIKVVFFSGYDDFSYAKQAIQLNILEYILKPVNAEELTVILVTIKQKLDKEETELNDIDALRTAFSNSLPILKENFLKNLMHGKVNPDQVTVMMDEYQISFAGSDWFVAALVSMEDAPEADSIDESQRKLIPLSVHGLLQRCLASYCNFEIINSSLGLCVVAGLGAKTEINEIMTVFRDAGKESQKILGQILTFGVGQPRKKLAELEGSYYEARDALGYRAVLGSGAVIFITDVEPEKKADLFMEPRVEADLTAAIKFGGRDQIQEAVETIINEMQHSRRLTSSHQAYLIGVMNTLLQIVQRSSIDADLVFGRMDYIEKLSSLQNDDELRHWLMDSCIRINQAINSGRENSTQSMIREARQFIEENYADPTISLETLCSHLHISIAYFSSTFKKEVGESYIAYLTRVRLEKAVELLGTTDEKTYIIARKVGYEEPNYFGYVFKKQYGVTPSHYRGQSR